MIRSRAGVATRRERRTLLGIGSTRRRLCAKHQMIYSSPSITLTSSTWPQHDFEYPKTHEEFMKEVVALALNGQPLPELQEDHEYCYVPEQGEVGLQIRLMPGSPKSKVPAGTTPGRSTFRSEMLARGRADPSRERPEAAGGRAADPQQPSRARRTSRQRRAANGRGAAAATSARGQIGEQ